MKIDPADLLDSVGIAELLGTSRKIVGVWLLRDIDLPAPVIDLGRGRPRLWDRRQILDWAQRTGRIDRATDGDRHRASDEKGKVRRESTAV